MKPPLPEHTKVPIAAALGNSETSALTRAFQPWSGQTPTAWRANDRSR
jgi:AraC-like DNA-binding protein